MESTFRWGILGCGRIAEAFAIGLEPHEDQALVAVASRDLDRARTFAGRHPGRQLVARAYDDYSALCRDPDVDAIYVATPHTFHAEHGKLVIEHGKALLLEKPFTVHEREAIEVIELARARDVFCMEAMWTRFRPAMVHALSLIRDGAIGTPEMVHASFGFRASFDPAGRHFDKGLAGGALLDVGVYCVSLADLVFDAPITARSSLATIGTTGVDERSGYLLAFEGGGLAVLSSAVRTVTSHDARIDGSKGSIVIPDFWRPTSVRAIQARYTREWTFDEPGNGYGWQALEVAKCVREGLRESPLRPLEATLRVQRELDRLRAPWGLRYGADRVSS
ncbi:MAG: Gfo/Idh/MocA family oxidoreductase [Planctomycetes bacterium]|nr:Gfo/Idh/MocA family oxidoreductase [Planctomycetota bacterium]MCB9917928.1 Gfo/Idh/MocA family oxidoreductase [Planctomycetota bacterium]